MNTYKAVSVSESVSINIGSLKSQGISLVIIRAGSLSGNLFDQDDKFNQYKSECINNGINYSLYFDSNSLSASDTDALQSLLSLVNTSDQLFNKVIYGNITASSFSTSSTLTGCKLFNSELSQESIKFGVRCTSSLWNAKLFDNWYDLVSKWVVEVVNSEYPNFNRSYDIWLNRYQKFTGSSSDIETNIVYNSEIIDGSFAVEEGFEGLIDTDNSAILSGIRHIKWSGNNGLTEIGIRPWSGQGLHNLLYKIYTASGNLESMLSSGELSGSSQFLSLIGKYESSSTSLIKFKTLGNNPDGELIKSIMMSSKLYKTIKEVEISALSDEVSLLIDEANSFGIYDPGALLYYCDIAIQNHDAAVSMCNGYIAEVSDLDKIHNKAINDQIFGRYQSRRERTYNNIKDLQDNGKLEQLYNIGNPSTTGKLLLPVQDKYYKISSKYGPRSFILNGAPYSDFHKGIDISAYGINGQPAMAACDATVLDVQHNSGGYGHAVFLGATKEQTGSIPMKIVYGHLQANSNSHLHTGQFIRAGTVVGLVGSTGQSSGPHLHFEIRTGNDNPSYCEQALEPSQFLTNKKS